MSNRPLCWACLELNAGEVLAGWFRWISARHQSWGKGVLKALGRRWIRVIGCRRTSHSFLWTQGWAFGSTQNRKNSVLVCVLVTQLCLTLWEPMDWDLPGSSVHGILQARILEWVAISFSRRSSWPRDRTHLGLLHCRQILYHLATRKAHSLGGEGNKPDNHWLFLLQPWLFSFNFAHQFGHCHTISTGIRAEQFTLRGWGPPHTFKGSLSLEVNLQMAQAGLDKIETFVQHSCTFKSSCDRK